MKNIAIKLSRIKCEMLEKNLVNPYELVLQIEKNIYFQNLLLFANYLVFWENLETARNKKRKNYKSEVVCKFDMNAIDAMFRVNHEYGNVNQSFFIVLESLFYNTSFNQLEKEIKNELATNTRQFI